MSASRVHKRRDANFQHVWVKIITDETENEDTINGVGAFQNFNSINTVITFNVRFLLSRNGV